ncbi:MAG TPA: porin family protein [Gemmatimonadales bacterium]|nr:porin family protein [Gemmatimonadales bacterium]
MRKLIRISALAALALSAVALTAQAQEKTMGIVAGVDFSTISGDFASDGSSSRTGFMGGLFYAFPVGGGNIMIEPEALYSMKGDKYDNSLYSGTEKLDYIEIPVLVKWSSKPSGQGIYLMAGPAINFNVACEDSGTDKESNTDYTDKCSDYSEVSVKSPISGVLGAGFSNGRFGIEGRYDFDLSDAVCFDLGAGSGGNLCGKNQVWAILLRVSK